MLWVHKANHNQFNSVWASETGPGVAMPRPSQEQIAKVHLGALAQAVLLDRAEYFDVLRDHRAAVTWDPPGTDFVSQYLDPERFLVQHNQEGLAPPVVSLPAQGTVAADGVVATRALTLLTGGVTTTITLRLVWGALGSRLLLTVDPEALPAERYKVLALRVGQSTDPNNAANRDQDFTLEVSSGSRTASVSASSLHRLLYPDAPPFGPAKIMMQTLRFPVAQLVEAGWSRETSVPSPSSSTGGQPVRSASAICHFRTSSFRGTPCSHRNRRKSQLSTSSPQSLVRRKRWRSLI